MERYLKPSEVARMLKLNTETVYQYIKKGDLPAARLSRKYIVTERDLERFIEKRKEARRVEKLGLSEKGKEMVERARLAAERIEDFIDEFPGATEKEIKEALDIEPREVERTRRRLETKGQIRREGDGSKAEWYANGEGK